MNFKRYTLTESVTFEGLGLHSGVPVRVVVHPGEKGIAFRLGSTRLSATPELVKDTTRCTKLGEISTIEHLMSALAGLQITDAEIELSANELPSLDGSAKPYVESMSSKTTEIGDAELPDLFERVFIQEGDVKIAISNGNGQWRYTFDTGERWPGAQVYETFDVIKDYPEQIAPSRTFGFQEEIPLLVEAGLARGLNLETALVLGQTEYANFALFEDEPARHKLLDLIGDLYLAGVPISCLNVVAERSGHKANVKAANLLRKAVGRF